MRLDGTVSVGNILTGLIAVGTVVALWYRQSQVVGLLVEAVEALKKSNEQLVIEFSKHESRINEMEITARVLLQVDARLAQLKGESVPKKVGGR